MATAVTATVHFPKIGRKAIEKYFNSTNLKLKLFRNNYSYSPDNIYSLYTEANFSGYAEAAVGPTSWNAPIEDGSGHVYMEFVTPLSFAHNGGGVSNDIFGWILVDPTDNSLIAVANYATAITLAALSDDIDVKIRVYLEEGPVPV
jgi:hypothetical protein